MAASPQSVNLKISTYNYEDIDSIVDIHMKAFPDFFLRKRD